jgi:hypothetical protein
MSTIPTLALIPSGVKASKVYSVLPTDGSGDFTFSRAGALPSFNATRVNKDGLIEEVLSNVPRLNYPMIDGVVSGCPSLLLEPERTNQWKYSESFLNAEWIKTEVTISENSTISPDGTLNASKIIDSTSNNEHRIRGNTAVFIPSGGNFSIFAKASEYSKFAIANLSDLYLIKFDLSNGTIISTETGWSNAKIEDYGNGWYRLSGTISENKTCGYGLLNDNGDFVFTGNGAKGVHIWGAQFEAAESYPTSYIKSNSGSITTRVAETANGAGDANTFNDSEGVLFAEISALANDGTFRFISLSDGTSSNRVSLFFSTSNTLNASVNGISSIGGFVGIQNNNKVAFKYKSGDYALWVNGIEVATSTATTGNHSNLNRLNFDFGQGSDDFYGNTKQIQYFDTALTDQELQQLTSL